MVVNRLLDAFFKTLDVVDAARDRVDSVLGRKPRPDPWAIEWPAPQDDADAEAADASKTPSDAPPKSDASDTKKAAKSAKPAAAKPAPAPKTTAPKASPKKAAAKKKASTTAAGAKPKPKKAAAAKSGSKSRKGSVDRSGKDYESPRATVVAAAMAKAQTPILTEDADHDGKKVLGRVLWALWVSEQAGETDGMTTGDLSALLHLVAKMDVFSTNIGRACRDHDDLIVVGVPDGRSKRYVLSDAGRAAAAAIPTTSSTK